MPIVITGFEPLDVLEGIRRVVVQLESGRAELENAYPRVVSAEGNVAAQQMLDEVFEVCDRQWRGIGEIPRERLASVATGTATFDAEARFDVGAIDSAGVGSPAAAARCSRV